MVNKPFDIWLETLKRHVATIEKQETLDRNTMKFVFEHAIAHLVLGWSMVSESHAASAKAGKHLVSETLARVGSQAKANREGAQRTAEAEAVVPWWKAKDRFETFARYLAQVMGMSTAAPYETIYDKLVGVAVLEEGEAQNAASGFHGWKSVGSRIWKKVTSRVADAAHFAEAVARFVNSDLKNVDVMDGAPSPAYNLSVLLGNVEKFLRDRGFTPIPLVPVDERVLGRRDHISRKVQTPVFDESDIRIPVKVVSVSGRRAAKKTGVKR